MSLPQFFKVKEQTPEHSKLHFIFEKGNKCRVIAIVDYWTQQALCPIHDTIQSFLRELPQDGTFDQDKIRNIVKGYTAEEGAELFSFDLTAATDRLPRELQEAILSALLDREMYGKAWSNLIAGRSFALPGGSRISYAVGQPMGAKSSFPMLALSHHVIVQLAALTAGLTHFTDYVILGDDIVIKSKPVADAYLILMGVLGMEISLNKSIVSTPSTTFLPVAEICKRLYSNGRD